MTLGNLIGLCIESFIIVILCIYLMHDARNIINVEPKSEHGGAIFEFVVAMLWMSWRIWLTGTSMVMYLGWR